MKPALSARLAVCVAIVLAIAPVAHATIIDNGQFGPNIGQVGGLFGSDAYAQSFTAPDDARLVKFGMWLHNGTPNPPLVRIDLWADDGEGNPDQENILIEGLAVQESIGDLTRFDTETDYLLTPGKLYHVVINGFLDQDTVGDYNSTYDGGQDTVPGGDGHHTNSMGLIWFETGGDFGIYVETTGAGGDCYADFTGDGVLDLFDFLEYVNAFNAGEDRADCTKDGVLDLFDFLCFVNAFNQSC